MGVRLSKPWKVFVTFLLLVLALPATAQTAQTEVPALADQVASGDLPPVAERLPAEPLVLEVDQIGTYGGTYNAYLFGEPGRRPLPAPAQGKPHGLELRIYRTHPQRRLVRGR